MGAVGRHWGKGSGWIEALAIKSEGTSLTQRMNPSTSKKAVLSYFQISKGSFVLAPSVFHLKE